MTTLSEAQAKLTEYQAAESRILQAQEIRIGGGGVDRTDRQADLAQVREGITYWQRMVNQLSASAAGRPSFAGMGYTVARFD